MSHYIIIMSDIFKNIKTKKEFAKLIGYKESALNYILFGISKENQYKTFIIPKKSGGVRIINAPNSHLKSLQSRLADYLNITYKGMFKTINPNNSLSHGFRTDHSIITNAKKHRNKRFVFNIDLKDFFPSLNFGRVRGFFIKNNHFQLNKDLSTMIAQIACYENGLPQGSPASPIISNLITHILDIRLVNLAQKFGCSYSRYADDITFSTNLKEFPATIAKIDENSSYPTKIQ